MNPLPIILLLGAGALLLGGGKKGKTGRKTPKSEWEKYVPPEGDTSEPVTKKPPQAPPPPKDLQPFASVKDLQKALKGLGYDVGKIDGKWGRETSIGVTSFQSDADIVATGIADKHTLGLIYQMTFEEPAPNECDPLLQDVPQGFGCFYDNGRYIVLPADMSALPFVSEANRSRNVVFSPDLSNMEIGVQWRYVVVEEWLNRQRAEDKIGLSSTKKTLEWLDEYFMHNPSCFLGMGNETVGSIIYMILILIATKGAGSRFFSAIFGAGRAASIAVTVMTWLGYTEAAIGAAGLFNVFTATPKELLQAQNLQLINEFAERHTVIVGNERVRIRDLPLSAPAVQQLVEHLMSWVAHFQKYQYDE